MKIRSKKSALAKEIDAAADEVLRDIKDKYRIVIAPEMPAEVEYFVMGNTLFISPKYAETLISA